MNSPAVGYLTLEEGPQKLWREWLGGYFDGAAHEVGPSGTGFVTFPQATLSFDQAALPQPLNGLNILVLQQTVDTETFLTPTGKFKRDRMRWEFFVRSASVSAGQGNPEYQCRQAAQLLHGCLLNENATIALAEKGITDLDVKEAEPLMSNQYQLRRIRAAGSFAYELRTL
jgi:hypothetical protein